MKLTDLEDVARRYKEATTALDAVRAEMQTTAVELLRQDGVKQADVARITGWSREHLRRLKEKAELEALRQQVAEMGATKKPRPAVAAPRQQVTEAIPEEPEPPDLTGVSPEVAGLPLERVKALAASAESRRPEWVAEVRQANPDANEDQIAYLIVEAGVQKGFRPPELADQPKAEPADRPISDEEAAEFAARARSKADELQLAKLDQLAGYAAEGAKDFAVMHAGLDMGLLTHDEVYGDSPAASEETAG